MIKWTDENHRLLHNIVMDEDTIHEGWKAAAELFDTSYYAIRNRWYHPSMKVLRGEIDDIQEVEEEITPDIKLRAASSLISDAQQAFEAIEQEITTLRAEIQRLKGENQELVFFKTKYKELEEEYNIIHRVIDRARQLTVREDLGEVPQMRFKMDRNGNLEAVGQ